MEVPKAPAAYTSKRLILCYMNLIFKKITTHLLKHVQHLCSLPCPVQNASLPREACGRHPVCDTGNPSGCWAAVPVRHLGAHRATGRALPQDTRTPCSPCCSEQENESPRLQNVTGPRSQLSLETGGSLHSSTHVTTDWDPVTGQALGVCLSSSPWLCWEGGAALSFVLEENKEDGNQGPEEEGKEEMLTQVRGGTPRLTEVFLGQQPEDKGC